MTDYHSNTYNYWHAIKPNSHSKGLHLHWDRELQLKEMKQYVRSMDDLERVMKLDTKLIQSALVIGIVLAIAGLLVLIIAGMSAWALCVGIILMIAGPMLAYYLYRSRLTHRRRTLKYSLVSQAIERYFHPEVYLAQKKLPDLLIKEAALVDSYRKAEVSDYFAGVWQMHPFQFGDLTITGPQPDSRRDAVLFSGQIFIVELGQEIPVPILIRERETLLSPELYEGRKNSPRFFITSNEQFDRQFALSFGEERRASGFEEIDENKLDEIKAQVHEIIDSMLQDILDADTYASSRTSIRLIHNRMYLAIENNRDTFELMKEDEKRLNLELLQKRFDEEAEHMTTYLDLMTRNGNLFKHPASAQINAEPPEKATIG